VQFQAQLKFSIKQKKEKEKKGLVWFVCIINGSFQSIQPGLFNKHENSCKMRGCK
jgi:hypothetical protein